MQHKDVEPRKDEINLIDLLLVITRRRKTIIIITFFVFSFACLISLLMPNIYQARAKILPPIQEENSISTTLKSLGDLAALNGGSISGNSADFYVGLLKSRRIADSVIEHFDLMDKYDWETRLGAYDALSQKVQISSDPKTQFITVAVEDENPEFSAKLANSYIEELKKLNVQINLNSFGRERAFLEERLKIVKAELTAAENRFRDFQEKHKAIKLDAQANAVIEGISSLKGEMAAKEVELGVLLKSQTEQNFQVKALREALSQLEAQLKKLENSPEGKNLSLDSFIATADVPDIGIQYARLMRNYKIQETLYELLTKQFEFAKINEAKNTSSIQVLDLATVPDRKFKPRRTIIVLASTFLFGLLAVFGAIIADLIQRMEAEDQGKWEELKNTFQIKNKS